ncbi:hypothetical protein LR010_01480 [Candidatus Gracilibacteria bacterium]|nr:hypothetical protein [Candidatus Gracilibacteria bacterium]
MKGYIKLLIILCSLSCFSSSFAAGALDHFEVVLGKTEAKVGEALDITISAVDKNNEIITDYSGDVLVFSESDAQAEFPSDLAENSYSFTAANEGSVKFENAVRFQNVGKQDIYVYDLNDENILGIAEIDISAEEVLTDVEILLLSPENGVTLGKNNITVSGTTQKNHQVRVVLNNDQDYFTTSNSDGVFEKDIEALQQGMNGLQAFVLNADDKVIGESARIDIKINSNAPEFKKLTITPIGAIQAETEISMELVSNAGLSKVQVIINDIITTLEETKDGIYIAKSLAPSEAGEYDVDVLLTDDFAHETQERGVETLTITAIPELKAGGDEPKEKVMVIETIDETPVVTDLDLTITNIEVTELKTKSVLTWKDLDDAEKYNIYKKIEDNKISLIETTTEPRFEIEITGDEIRYEDFAIKAIGKTSSGETIQGSLSEMTKVKTGPEMYIFMALIALLLTSGIFFMKKNQA